MLHLQELVEIVGRSTGIALMAPPTDSDTAQKTLDTLLSAVNKKQKVASTPYNLYLASCATSHVCMLPDVNQDAQHCLH